MKKLTAALLILSAVLGFACCGAAENVKSPESTQALARPEYEILILVDSRELYLFRDEELYKTYHVAVGRPSNPTPRGDFTITSMIKCPYAESYGSRWIGLSAPNIGIHGTNAPDSIGSEASSGCIRMKNGDVEELFDLVGIGTKVFIL
jgi:lipoprotein-anchoring transpeptidase ErfK/SrfK